MEHLAQARDRASPVQGFHHREQSRDQRQHAPGNVLQHRPGRLPAQHKYGGGRDRATDEGRQAKLDVERGRSQQNNPDRADADGGQFAFPAQFWLGDVEFDLLLIERAMLSEAQDDIGHDDSSERRQRKLAQPLQKMRHALAEHDKIGRV